MDSEKERLIRSPGSCVRDVAGVGRRGRSKANHVVMSRHLLVMHSSGNFSSCAGRTQPTANKPKITEAFKLSAEEKGALTGVARPRYFFKQPPSFQSLFALGRQAGHSLRHFYVSCDTWPLHSSIKARNPPRAWVTCPNCKRVNRLGTANTSTVSCRPDDPRSRQKTALF